MPAENTNKTSSASFAKVREIRTVREIDSCLIFTGLEPCGEHKNWCGPWLGFTRRICTPSLLKIWYCVAERTIILDRGHPAQTGAFHEPWVLIVLRNSVAVQGAFIPVGEDATAPIDEILPMGPVQ